MRKVSPFAISLQKICQDRGLRLTEQRKVIVRLLEETISDTKFHPDVDEIYSRAIKIDKKISVATVYRTVKLLEENGIIDKEDGFLSSLTLSSEYPLITNWGLINQVGNIRVSTIRRGFFTMMNQVDVDSLTLNSSSARKALVKAFKGVNSVEISNYFY